MKWFAPVLATIGLLVVTSVSQACHHPCCYIAPCCVNMVEKMVTCYKPEWKEREVKCTVNKIVPKEVVETRTCTIMEPEYKDVKRVCTVFERQPVVVEREIVRRRKVPVTCVDPCTGCTYTHCERQCVVEKVQCTEWKCVPKQVEQTVRVCTYKPVQKTYECKRIVCEVKPETVVRKERYCEMVAYQTKVLVPECAK